MKSTALIVTNQHRVQTLFSLREFDIIYEANLSTLKTTPDLIVFTGGEDVDPKLYGEEKHFRTSSNPRRDARELEIFERFREVPKVGICRGGQFLNVVSGGKLWQHVEGHVNSDNSHDMIDLLFARKKIRVPSGHHQMMIPSYDGWLLGVAQEGKGFISLANKTPPKPTYDPEVIWYPKTNSLCYQSHPEWNLPEQKDGSHRQHVDYFFDLLDWAFQLP